MRACLANYGILAGRLVLLSCPLPSICTAIRRAVDRFRRFAYAGCFHAGPVTRIFGRSFGGSKYSFNCVRGVVEKFLLAPSGDGIRTWQAPQVLKGGNLGPWMNACRVCEMCVADCPLAIVAIIGLEIDICRGLCKYG